MVNWCLFLNCNGFAAFLGPILLNFLIFTCFSRNSPLIYDRFQIGICSLDLRFHSSMILPSSTRKGCRSIWILWLFLLISVAWNSWSWWSLVILPFLFQNWNVFCIFKVRGLFALIGGFISLWTCLATVVAYSLIVWPWSFMCWDCVLLNVSWNVIFFNLGVEIFTQIQAAADGWGSISTFQRICVFKALKIWIYFVNLLDVIWMQGLAIFLWYSALTDGL